MAAPGDLNSRQQLVIGNTQLRSTTRDNQRVWEIECQHCKFRYGANGCDLHERKCPNCQGGKPGEPLTKG